MGGMRSGPKPSDLELVEQVCVCVVCALMNQLRSFEARRLIGSEKA